MVTLSVRLEKTTPLVQLTAALYTTLPSVTLTPVTLIVAMSHDAAFLSKLQLGLSPSSVPALCLL